MPLMLLESKPPNAILDAHSVYKRSRCLLKIRDASQLNPTSKIFLSLNLCNKRVSNQKSLTFSGLVQ